MNHLSQIVIASFFSVLLFAVQASQAHSDEVRIVDGDTLEIDGQAYRLHGVDAPEAGQHCATLSGGNWACGDMATRRLIELVGDIVPRCENLGRDDYDRVLAICSVDQTELNRAMVEEGFAWAFRRYSEDYSELEDVARFAGVGVWQAPTETPWDYRERRWEVAEQAAPEGCPIKGNISNNGHIYHPPWSPWYDRTKISPERGEQWFCSEREALDAGWRAPRWGN